MMGRRRKIRRDLPPRVYFDHGAYFFVPRFGRKVHLGRDLGPALMRWAELVQLPMNGSDMASILDRYAIEGLPKLATRTQVDYRYAIARLRAVFGEMFPDEIDPPMIYEYMRRSARVVANRDKAVLSSVFVAAIKWGVAKDNPCRLVKRNTERRRTRRVSDEELEAFRTKCGQMIRAYVAMKELIGLRKEDMLSLTFDHLGDEGIEIVPGKTKDSCHTRLLFEWSTALRDAVEMVKSLPRRAECPYLFASRLGGKYSTSGFDSIWQRAMDRYVESGGVRFWEHDIRAKAASDAEDAGSDPQKLLGHASRTTTERYLRARQVIRVKPAR